MCGISRHDCMTHLLGAQVFLDSDDLMDLGQLCVQASVFSKLRCLTRGCVGA